MWTCSKCGVRVDSWFEVCWSCGTSQDGVEDPTFVRETDLESGGEGSPKEFTSTKPPPPVQQAGTMIQAAVNGARIGGRIGLYAGAVFGILGTCLVLQQEGVLGPMLCLSPVIIVFTALALAMHGFLIGSVVGAVLHLIDEALGPPEAQAEREQPGPPAESL